MKFHRYIVANGPLTDGDIFYTCGALLIENRVIIDMGSYEPLRKKWPDTPVIDVAGRLIVPGFTNFHHHLYSSLATGLQPLGETSTFTGILQNLWWPLDFVLDEESIYYSALYGIMRSIQAGVTSIFDHHSSLGHVKGSLNTISAAFRESGIRGVLCYEMTERGGRDFIMKQLDENLSFWREHKKDTKLQGMLGLHANFTLSEETLHLVKKEKPSYLPIHIHCGESQDDLLFYQNLGYEGPIHRLAALGLLSCDSFLVHCLHLSDYDYAILKDFSPWVITTPESNANNRVGNMDRQKISKFLIGTDGLSDDILSSYRNYVITATHSPEPFEKIEALIWKWPRLVRERYWGFQGVFAIGEPADVAVLDYRPVTTINKNNIIAHLIYGAEQGKAFLSVCDGKILWKDGKFFLLDQEEIFQKAKQAASRLHNRFIRESRKESFPWSK